MSYFESMIWSVSHCKGKYPIAKGTPRKNNIQIQAVLKTTLYQYVFLYVSQFFHVHAVKKLYLPRQKASAT